MHTSAFNINLGLNSNASPAWLIMHSKEFNKELNALKVIAAHFELKHAYICIYHYTYIFKAGFTAANYLLPAAFELQVYSSDAWNNQVDIYTMPTVGFELRLRCCLNSSAWERPQLDYHETFTQTDLCSLVLASVTMTTKHHRQDQFIFWSHNNNKKIILWSVSGSGVIWCLLLLNIFKHFPLWVCRVGVELMTYSWIKWKKYNLKMR